MVAWAVLPQYVFRSSCFKCFQDATHSNLRSCPYVVNLIKSILLLPYMWFNSKTNKALQYHNVSKKKSHFETPNPHFNSWQDQLSDSDFSILSHVHEYWTKSSVSLFPPFRHSKSLHVSQSFSSSTTREFEKDRKRKGISYSSIHPRRYTVLFLCNISLLFDGHKWLRDTRPKPYHIYIIPHFCQTGCFLFLLRSNIYCATVKNVRSSWLP